MTRTQSRIEALFCAAVDIAHQSERSRFLERECGGDVRLRTAVDDLIQNHEAAGSFLIRPACMTALPAIPVDAGFRPGAVVDSYRIERKIGEGGFGAVFLAEQLAPVRRSVALKVIKPGMDSEEVIRRFDAERQVLALMNHPNIASVFDAGATESGHPYFVMELVDGVPLTEYCDQHHLSTRDRLRLFVDVCHAVQHAHQKGIIHRDLKPSNIIVTMHDGKPLAKVIDFGVAKALSKHVTEKTFTVFGQMIGTPAYMSPEQTEAAGLDIDTRSDVYSLGVLLYELLTGCTPFDAVRLRQAGYAEMQRIIREEDPPKPSTRLTNRSKDTTAVSENRGTDPRKLSQMVRGDLDWIVMKSLEKDRNRRYETADRFAQDVLRFLQEEPVEAHPPSAAYRFAKLARRHKRTLATAAIVAAALVVATAVSVYQAIDAARSERLAQTEAATALAVEEFINRDLLGPNSPFDEPDRNLTVREALDRASARIAGRFQDQPLVEAAIQHTIGTSYFTLGEYQLAEAHLRPAVEARRTLLGPEHDKTLASEMNLAAAIFELGGYDEARRRHERLLNIESRLHGIEHERARAALMNLSAVFYKQGNYERAEELSRRLLEIQDRILDEEDPSRLMTLMNLAAVRKARGHFAEAEEHCRSVLEVQSRILGDEHPETLKTKSVLANCRLSRGDLEDAAELHRQVLEVRLRVLGAEHPATLNTRNNLGLMLQKQGALSSAHDLWREILPIQERVLGNDHPETLQTMMNLGNVLDLLGHDSEAEALHRNVLERRQRVLGSNHPDTIESAFCLANAILSQDRLVEAESYYRDVVERQTSSLGADHPTTLLTRSNLAIAIHKQGRYAEAESLRREILAAQRRVLGPRHHDTYATMLNLGNAMAAQDRYPEAIEIYREVLPGLEALVGPDHPSTLKCRLALGRAQEVQGLTAEAEENYRYVLEGQRRVLSGNHPDTLYTSTMLAWLLCFSAPEKQRDFGEALDLARDVMAQNPVPHRHLRTLGQAEYRAGNYAAALDALRQSVAMHGLTTHDLLMMALCFWQLGDRDLAMEFYQRAPGHRLDACAQRLNDEFLQLTSAAPAGGTIIDAE